MSIPILIKQATIVNNGRTFEGSVWIEPPYIHQVFEGAIAYELLPDGIKTIEAKGLLLLPGVIDDQVHFREPGLTDKGSIVTESRAALAGGVTSYMDMPNVIPPTTTIALLDHKREIAATDSLVNYAFFLGATASNMDQICQLDPHHTPGVKLFMGSSTGDMKVDDTATLEAIFAQCPHLIAAHCESDSHIAANRNHYVGLYGEDLAISFHPQIRDVEACYQSSAQAVDLADRYGTRLHLFHLSTARELSLLSDAPIGQKSITAEVCVHHLLFEDRDYERLGSRIKWNPAIKSQDDKYALWQGLSQGKLDVVATDHAPHTWQQKQGGALQAASGGPMIQHSLQAMLSMFPATLVVEKMSHAPARLFNIDRRGYIKPGYYADLVLVDPERPYLVDKSNILSKCGWSPLEGMMFMATPMITFVNGSLAYTHQEGVQDTHAAMELQFNR